MTIILSLDIGGANTKFVVMKEELGMGKLLVTQSNYFPLWKKHQEYVQFLRELKNKIEVEWGVIDKVVFVTTAELADCFETKKEGIKTICAYVKKIFNQQRPEIMDVRGNFLPIDKAGEKWLEVAASNWYASARYLAETYNNAILIDIGSTTTDIIPIFQGEVVAQGKNDLERLSSYELVYTGLLRTNVATFVPGITVRGKDIPLASELFATTGDVYFLLGAISREEFSVETTDNKPITKENSMKRLARVICADINQLEEKEIIEIAQQIQKRQLDSLSKALKIVLGNYQKHFKVNPKILLIGSGAKAIGKPLLQRNAIFDGIIVNDVIKQKALNNFSVFAVAQLFIKNSLKW